MSRLHTKLGEFFIDDATEGDCRIGVVDVEIVENRGPESIYGWSTDQQEAIENAARAAGGTSELITPGGWRVAKAYLPATVAALERIASQATPTNRRTVL